MYGIRVSEVLTEAASRELGQGKLLREVRGQNSEREMDALQKGPGRQVRGEDSKSRDRHEEVRREGAQGQ